MFHKKHYHFLITLYKVIIITGVLIFTKLIIVGRELNSMDILITILMFASISLLVYSLIQKIKKKTSYHMAENCWYIIRSCFNRIWIFCWSKRWICCNNVYYWSMRYSKTNFTICKKTIREIKNFHCGSYCIYHIYNTR